MKVYARLGAMLAALLVALAGAACSSGGDDDAPGAKVTLLEPAEYQAALAAETDPFVVNLHIPYEGEIDGTDVFVPFDDVEAHAAELPADKSAPLYIYCRSGRMSAEATPALQALGYANIIDLKGGMNAWREAGLEILDKAY